MATTIADQFAETLVAADVKEHVKMTPQFILSVAAVGAIRSVTRYLVDIASGQMFRGAKLWPLELI